MYESDVEWFTDELDISARVKSAIWDDAAFKELIIERGLEQSLRDVSTFHKTLTSQLIAKGITSPEQSDWARKTINLAARARSRRNEIRRAVRLAFTDGDAIVAEIRAEMEGDWRD